MFGGTTDSRIFDRIRNREGLSYGVNSHFIAPVDGNLAQFISTVISNPANAPKVEASFTDELKKTVQQGFTAAEVEAKKKAFLDERKVGRSQDGQLTGLLALRAEHDRTMKWDEDMDAKYQALTADQVNAAVKRHLDIGALSIVKAGDFKTAGVY
jgi:zinc protease